MKHRLLAATALGACLLGAVVGAQSAAAADYRYWSYWQGGADGWRFATIGPALRIVHDGDVDGWRFAVGGVDGLSKPRSAADVFSTVCPDPAPHGKVRVAVIVDPGLPTDAPEGETPGEPSSRCVLVADGATGYDVLRGTVSVRSDSGLICALDGYPAHECGNIVSTEPTPAPSRSASPDPQPTGQRSTETNTPSPSATATAPASSESDSAQLNSPSPSRTRTVRATESAASPTPTVSSSALTQSVVPSPSSSTIAPVDEVTSIPALAANNPTTATDSSGSPIATIVIVALLAIVGAGFLGWRRVKR